MKKITSLLLILLPFFSCLAQSSNFRYDDYFYYKNNLFLQTPFVLINTAVEKMKAGDSLGAISLLKEAAATGVYDTTLLIPFPQMRFITQTPQWKIIAQQIAHTRAVYDDPRNMQIITSDIDNFWKIFDRRSQPGIEQLIMKEYILKGTMGLRTFFDVRMNSSVTQVIQFMRSHKKYLQSIRPVSQNLQRFKPGIIAAANKLEALYPPAIFPPTTFLIGIFNTFGTTDGGAGSLIGAEFICDTNTVVKDELNAWRASNISDSSELLGIIIHELIHVEQRTLAPKTLLDRAINEGAADFVSQLVLGFNSNSKMHVYGNAHEKELWPAFKKQMDGTQYSDWLYNGQNTPPGVPADLGYYIGFKICEAYYNKAADKKQAVQDILTIQDFKKFFELSGYGQ
ncbi:hypothetical protein A4H97_24370 [Niastella yeongjuensis]|uniref:Uncharacterized protein n=1 Tax=Niastella yeongjuensis TaxID=354355 RepID=A0A1V9F3N7_9BACT|nr:DUF2268 domain-containing putative Zn-dependent protease [Niastella yeongjuensis]OQP52835.1 hypothetical protein A4H97_24370 [Niastella yeongjuensis]SEP20802.1 Predicted Zn-dependent protease [Niastella yeongjuensis]